jgi:hypothetical protein
MTITKKPCLGKEKTIDAVKIAEIGNIVPNWLYRQLTLKTKPDLVAITIIAELLFLYRSCGGTTTFDSGYSYFEQKFNLPRPVFQKALARLQHQGLVNKSFKTSLIAGKKISNNLHLTLNLEKLVSMMPTSRGKFDYECYGEAGWQEPYFAERQGYVYPEVGILASLDSEHLEATGGSR